MKRKIVIIGGGFGGLNVAKSIHADDVEITLIDKTNHHLFQPLLYQVATTALSPGDIAVPLRSILKNYRNVRVVMGEVDHIDKDAQTVRTVAGQVFDYDSLVIATGAKHAYFGHDEWATFAPGLKTLDDALSIREKILMAFERAEILGESEFALPYLTFVIVGGGPTGVEMAGAIAEIAHHTLRKDFRSIDPTKARVILVEGSSRILSNYPEFLSNKARESLASLGVELIQGRVVTQISEVGVQIGNELIAAKTVIWAAGNRAPAFLETLDVPIEKSGQVQVGGDLTIPGYPNVFVIGDSARVLDINNLPLPGIAPVATQQGKYVGKILSKKDWKRGRPIFRYFDKGIMATIGRASAVAYIFSF